MFEHHAVVDELLDKGIVAIFVEESRGRESLHWPHLVFGTPETDEGIAEGALSFWGFVDQAIFDDGVDEEESLDSYLFLPF